MNEEILEKVCFVLNLKELECHEELLSNLNRLILTGNNTTSLDKFIEEINDRFPDVSFSNDFLQGIFELSTEEIAFIFQQYFKHKREKNKL